MRNWSVPAYWYGKHRAASLFGTGPVYGTNADQYMSWFYYGGGDALYRELTQDVLKLNVVGFFAFAMPTQPLGWFKKALNGPEDFKGMKYRTVGLASNVMQAMGASVAQLPGPEILPAMEKGVIDAFEFNNPTSDSRFGAQDVAKFYYLGSYHQASEAIEVVYNKDKFNALAKEQQQILKIAAQATSADGGWKAWDIYSTDLQTLITKHAVQVKRTPVSIFKAQLAAWDTGGQGDQRRLRHRARSSRRSSSSQEGLGQEGRLLRDQQRSGLQGGLRALLRGDEGLIKSQQSPGRQNRPGEFVWQQATRNLRGKYSTFHRPSERGRRQGVRLVHHHHDAGHQLRSLRSIRPARAHQLGVRSQLFHVRRAFHDGRRLHAVAQWPRARRFRLSYVAVPGSGFDRSRPLFSIHAARVSARCFITAFPMPRSPGQIHEVSIYSPTGAPVYPHKTLIPIAAFFMLLQCFAEMVRCIICIRDGVWPQRLHDVEEMESAILAEAADRRRIEEEMHVGAAR